MVSEWPIVTLEQISEIKSGKRLPRGQSLVSVKTDFPYIRLVDIADGRIQYKDLQYLTSKVRDSIKRYIVNSEDVCLAIVGHTIGMVFYVTEEWDNVNLTENAARITKVDKSFNPKFIYYFLRSSYGQSEIISRTVGSAQGKLPLYNIKSLPIPKPSREYQDYTVDILDSISNKIELNKQTNQTLEQIAQALFKSWFVGFDPVIDNALAAGSPIPDELQERSKLRQRVIAESTTNPKLKPLPDDIQQLFPSEFEESELGWIPKGWEVTSFESLISLIGGGTPKTTIDDYWGGDIPWFSVVDAPNDSDVFVIETEKHVTQLGVDKSSTKILREGTTIISARGTVGKCALVGSPMAMNQSCYGIVGKFENHDEYIYFLTRYQVSDLQKRGHGSVFNTITRETFKSISLAKSGDLLTQKFSEIVRPYLAKVLSNNKQNIELTKLRDVLLPKLISGELII